MTEDPQVGDVYSSPYNDRFYIILEKNDNREVHFLIIDLETGIENDISIYKRIFGVSTNGEIHPLQYEYSLKNMKIGDKGLIIND